MLQYSYRNGTAFVASHKLFANRQRNNWNASQNQPTDNAQNKHRHIHPGIVMPPEGGLQMFHDSSFLFFNCSLFNRAKTKQQTESTPPEAHIRCWR